MQVEKARVVEHQVFQGEYRLLVLDAPGIAPHTLPGQFVHLRVPHMQHALLRRPFSIFKVEGPTLSLLYKSVGTGTKTMTMLTVGEDVSLIGPLGHGFPLCDAEKKPVLVAGGYGMAALYLLARALPTPGHAFFGGAAAGDILCVGEFEKLGWTVHVATEDGSLGTCGRVTDALDPWLEETGSEDVEFYACGPSAMLRAIGDRARRLGRRAWISVDESMGCGVGACLACVVKVRSGDDWVWARSCTEGPVFECRDVIWDQP